MRNRTAIVLVLIMLMILGNGCENKVSKGPDCIGSFIMNNDYMLQIVANRVLIINGASI